MYKDVQDVIQCIQQPLALVCGCYIYDTQNSFKK